MAQENISKLTMKLFGLPYQFPSSVDPRVNGVSSIIGKKFTENILMEAPVCTIIPGEPEYLPGKSGGRKSSTASALIEAQNGRFQALEEVLKNNKDENLRLYDFKPNYADYIRSVNAMCRTGAIYLGLDNYTVSFGKSYSTVLSRFDWRNYKWNTDATTSYISRLNAPKQTVTNSLYGRVPGAEFLLDTSMTEDEKNVEIDQVFKNYNYLQFYIDPDVSPSDTLTNSTGESMMKSMMDQGSSTLKEFAFMANSGGMNTASFNKFAEESTASLQSFVNGLSDPEGHGVVSRIINLGGNVLQGHNIIIPNIYQNSSYQKSYTITVHLKTPYGSKLGYYFDIFVPMMHLLALAMPKQESANSYSSPYLVKAYVDGMFSCNLGIVESISINKVTETLTVDGLPTEVDVSLSITDLYSDLTLSPTDEPFKFANNSSLLEYLATNCGLSLTSPNLEEKVKNIITVGTNAIMDIPGTLGGMANEAFGTLFTKLLGIY